MSVTASESFLMHRLGDYVADASGVAARSTLNQWHLQECIDYALAMHRLILEQADKTATHTEDDTAERLAAMEYVEQMMLKWLEPRKALAEALTHAEQQGLPIERTQEYATAVLDFRGSTSITARAAFEQMKRMRREGYSTNTISIEEWRRELRNRARA